MSGVVACGGAVMVAEIVACGGAVTEEVVAALLDVRVAGGDAGEGAGGEVQLADASDVDCGGRSEAAATGSLRVSRWNCNTTGGSTRWCAT